VESKDQKHNAQNRLLVATAVLTFLYYAEAKFQGISAIGATIVFKNEDAVQEFAWVVWGYYYARTYQYYKETGVETFRKALNEGYVEEIGYLLLNMREHEFKLLPSDDAIKSSIIRLGFGSVSSLGRGNPPQASIAYSLAKLIARIINASRRWRSAGKARVAGGLIRINFLRPSALNGSVVRRVLRWIDPFGTSTVGVRAVIYPPTNRFDQQGQHKYHVRLPAWSVVKIASVYFRTILLRPQFTENQIPLIVGLAPVWYLLVLDRAQLTQSFGQLAKWFGLVG
jgi:hypothetical protein